MGSFWWVKYCPILLVLFGFLNQPEGIVQLRKADLDPWADDSHRGLE